MKHTMHLVRETAGVPSIALAATDWIVYRNGSTLTLDGHGQPPSPVGPIDELAFVKLCFIADRVVTW